MLKNATIILALAISCAIPAQAQTQTTSLHNQHAKAVMDAALAKARNPAAPAPLSDGDDMSLPAFEKKWTAMLAQSAHHQFTTNIDADLLTSMTRAVACGDIVGFAPSGFARNALDAKLLDGATLFARCDKGGFVVITARSTVSQPGHTVIIDPAAYPLTIAGLPARKMYYKSAQGREKTVLAIVGADILYSVSHWSDGDGSLPRMTASDHLDQAAVVLAQQNNSVPPTW